MIALLLVLVGQPLLTDDAWWHLALGRAYATLGPWLSEDPLLFTAPGPPAPTAWLADLGLYATHRLGGFPALRSLHLGLVAATVALGWSVLARGTRSRVLASLGSALFILFATYRLVQLRPHLFSILATLLLYRLLFENPAGVTPRRMALAVGLLALWTNLHAGFVLGPVLVGTGLLALLLAELAKPAESRNWLSPPVRRTALVLVLGTLATGLNPAGIEPHMAYWIAGAETPSLQRVGDEWAALDLFSFPAAGGVPSAAAWVAIWLLLVATLGLGGRLLLRVWRTQARDTTNEDLVRLALALLALGACTTAVRFLWLAVFPLLFVLVEASRSIAENPSRHPMRVLGTALCVVAIVPLYGFTGDWPRLARSIPRTLEDYARDYPPERYHAHAVWWLDDTRTTGDMFAEYSKSGFIGYRLGTRVRSFINGSLNVSREAIDANLPIRERRGARTGERFGETLDRLGIDLFLGIRLPQTPPTARPWFHTTGHLEGTAGWILVFRNIDSAVYLRDVPHNQANLARITSYYDEHGIAFDPARGFDPAVAITQSPSWSMEHGVVPVYFDELLQRARGPSSPLQLRSLVLLAEVQAALGLYESAIASDLELLRMHPATNASQRRVIWSLLRLGRHAEAARRANAFTAQAPIDRLSRQIISLAKAAASGELEEEELASRIARLPVFTLSEAARLRAGMARPEVR